MRAVVFVNPHSGSAGSSDDLAQRFPGADVNECHPDELGAQIDAALEAGPAWIGVAGGDGTLGTAAGHLKGGDTPLLVIPAGTRNHFAHDLGLDDVDAAAAAAADGVVKRVAVGTVGDRTFVNNAGIGMYPALVRHREEMEDRLPKQLAAIAAGIRLARHPRPLRLDALGRNDKVWMVFVGNGRYGESLGDVTTRAAMGDGELDVRVLWADDRRTWPRLLLGTAIHGLRDDPAAHIERRTSLDVSAHTGSVSVAIDGEVVDIPTPFTFGVEPEALPVLVPPRSARSSSSARSAGTDGSPPPASRLEARRHRR